MVHINGIQETSIEGKVAVDFIKEAKTHGWEAVLGPLDPEHTRKSAGVAFTSREGMTPLSINPKTRDYNDAEKIGRLMIKQWELQEDVLQICNVYGWKGGTKGSKAAERTDDLLLIGASELGGPGAGT